MHTVQCSMSSDAADTPLARRGGVGIPCLHPLDTRRRLKC
jgi:hypothetical protein